MSAATSTTSPTTVTGPSVWERRSLLAATVFAVTAVAGIAGAISYGHMHDWAGANGEPAWRALLFPLSVDGLLIAASVVLLADSRAGRKGDWLAYLLAGLGASVSIAANVAHDWVSPVASTAIAGWPPVALLGSYELLMRLLRRLRAMPAQLEAVQTAEDGSTTEDQASQNPQNPQNPTTEATTPTRPSSSRSSRSAPKTGRKSSTSPSKGKAAAEAWWRTHGSKGHEPTGAELARVAGVDDSLGRRWRREWLDVIPAGIDKPDHHKTQEELRNERAAAAAAVDEERAA